MNYDEYKGFYEIPKEGKPIPKFRSFFEQILKLSDDRSHITLKLRQILNCIRFNTLNEDLSYNWKIEDDDYEKSVNKIKTSEIKESCIKAKIVGIKTATILPIVGIKFKTKAINPHKTAPSKEKY